MYPGYKESIRPINRLLLTVLGERTNVGKLIEWTSEHPRQYALLLKSFDDIVVDFNSRKSTSLPDYYINYYSLKQTLGRVQLRTIESMMTGVNWTETLRFGRTLRTVNGLMSKGETTQTEPFLAYHIAPSDGEALVVGSIFHIAEEHLLNLMPIQIPRGLIEGALIETLSLQKENPLWHIISETDRLNWVNAWPGFHLRFRQNLGFE